MTYIPATPDWQWFGSLNDEQLAEYVADNSNIAWLQDAERWRTGRKNVLFLRNYAPVLTAANGDGQLGFIAVDNNTTYGEKFFPSEFEEHAYTAASFVFDLFRPFDKSLTTPHINILLNKTGGGSSLSLPTMIAALQRLTGIRLPDTIVATGCFDNSRKRLLPVSPDTLPAKIKVAKRFGYRMLLVVKGQTFSPNASGVGDIQIIEVDENPQLALFDVIKLAENQNDAEEGIARLLGTYSNRRICVGIDEAERITKPFVNSISELVRHVANDICSRAALHQGKTEKSAVYRKAAGTLEWDEIPTDALGHYLRYEEVASSSVLAIDSGEWDDNFYAHTELDKRIEHLKQAVKGGFADADDYLSLFAMLNTRALRRRFVSRYARVLELQSAWNDLTYFYSEWDKIFAYANRIDRRDTTFERQRNYCLECLADWYHLIIPHSSVAKELPLAKEFLSSYKLRMGFAEDNKLNGFDCIAWIHYRYLIDEPFWDSDGELAIYRIRNCGGLEFPNYISYELLLRYRTISQEERDFCVKKLRCAYNEQQKRLKDSPASIMSILALRTRQILLNNDCRNLRHPVTPPKDTPLRKIYDDLLSAPDTLIERCPY
ncbi:hypothetical protein FACS189454_09300 [Planctomycetales bacterium]|nr:hypothetical protein FACS189454_09300 [Planctomycetales bacterium]